MSNTSPVDDALNAGLEGGAKGNKSTSSSPKRQTLLLGASGAVGVVWKSEGVRDVESRDSCNYTVCNMTDQQYQTTSSLVLLGWGKEKKVCILVLS